MSTGKAKIKADYPQVKERTIRRYNPELRMHESVRQCVVEKHRFYDRGWHEVKLWTGWTRLIRLCKQLAESGAVYEVWYEFTEQGALVEVEWIVGA